MSMKRLNPTNWFSSKTWTVIGIVFSILLAVASSIFSWKAVQISSDGLAEQRRQFSEVQTEKLGVELIPVAYDPIKLTEINFGSSGRVVMTPWKLRLSNTGQQKMSITGYELSEGEGQSARYYTGLNGGIWSFTKNKKRIDPSVEPISLEPGDTHVYLLQIGILIKPEVAKVLSIKADVRTGLIMDPANELALSGLDLFGNKVDFQQFPDGFILTRLTNNKTPTYLFKATTGRNNVFKGYGRTESAISMRPLDVPGK